MNKESHNDITNGGYVRATVRGLDNLGCPVITTDSIHHFYMVSISQTREG